MSDFKDQRPWKFHDLTDHEKKEQARLRKELGFDENGKKIDASASTPEVPSGMASGCVTV
jgi:hypothetical protein